MTKEEAIKEIEDRIQTTEYVGGSYVDCVDIEALRMAVSALRQPERKKGKWILKKELVPLPWDCSPLPNDDYDAATHSVWQEYYHCSNCDWKSGEFKGGDFCPNCGAYMKEGEAE